MKLGSLIPQPTVKIVHNPDFNPFIWRFIKRGTGPNQFSPHGPFKREIESSESYRGNMVFDNEKTLDYTKVSLDKDGFYFWASVDSNNGNLTIHVRRDFHEDLNGWHTGENEIAYEDSFLINACDERTSIIPADISERGFYDKRFLAQPYLTTPFAQQLKNGPAYEEGIGNGLFVKKRRSHRGDFYEIVRKTNGNYVLTYPHQHKDALWTAPFFYSDDKHTYFIERGKEEKCFTYFKYVIDENSVQKWISDCNKYSSLQSKFKVQNHEHPFACMLTAEFNRFGIEGLYNSKNPKISRQLYGKNYFASEYLPHFAYVTGPHPMEEYDFTRIGSHSTYNWELFFHIPSLIARQLRLSGKFVESIKWLQFIFDPTDREQGDFVQWRIKPFVKDVSKDSINNLLKLLSLSNPNQAQENQRKLNSSNKVHFFSFKNIDRFFKV